KCRRSAAPFVSRRLRNRRKMRRSRVSLPVATAALSPSAPRSPTLHHRPLGLAQLLPSRRSRCLPPEHSRQTQSSKVSARSLLARLELFLLAPTRPARSQSVLGTLC